MTKLAAVETLYETNCRSIADMLREAAGSIDKEADDPDCDPTRVMVAVQLTAGGEVQVYGWGDTDNILALATLQLGIGKLTRMTLGGDE